MVAAQGLEKQQELVEKIQEKEEQIRERDPVYVQVKGYIAQIMLSESGKNTAAGSGSNAGSRLSSRSPGPRDGGAFDRRAVSASLTVDSGEEDRINRIGDILFKESAPGNQGSFAPIYTMKWGHIALYAGQSQIYDAHPDDCANTNNDGVALRPLNRIYENADSVMYSQLDNRSWRWSQSSAVDDAKSAYGTNCSTPFTRNPFTMSGTSKFFCSKLVWRVYLDNDTYSVNVDSNAVAYHRWLQRVWPDWLAGIIIINTVAPDEIALSPHLDDYRTLD